jgi:hypothetical protein
LTKGGSVEDCVLSRPASGGWTVNTSGAAAPRRDQHGRRVLSSHPRELARRKWSSASSAICPLLRGPDQLCRKKLTGPGPGRRDRAVGPESRGEGPRGRAWLRYHSQRRRSRGCA